MKIAIFGVTGRIGSAIMEKALEDGDFVTALVRDPSKLTIKHENLTIIQGDATDAAGVDQAVYGADAVISAMATSASKKIAKGIPLTRGMQNIINAMGKYSVKRLIITAGKVFSQPEDVPDIRFKLLKFIVKFLVPAGYHDTAGSVDVVMSSATEWTVVRVDRASYAQPTGIKTGYVNKEMGIGITRADAAAFILKEMQERKYIRQAPAICSRRLHK
jgi:NAD(P)-dependent dehydrogenase (short-subunit alcohol dehydrogenase family)